MRKNQRDAELLEQVLGAGIPLHEKALVELGILERQSAQRHTALMSWFTGVLVVGALLQAYSAWHAAFGQSSACKCECGQVQEAPPGSGQEGSP